MSIESSKKTLKVVGILSMIVSILTFIGTLIFAVAVNYLINALNPFILKATIPNL